MLADKQRVYDLAIVLYEVTSNPRLQNAETEAFISEPLKFTLETLTGVMHDLYTTFRTKPRYSYLFQSYLSPWAKGDPAIRNIIGQIIGLVLKLPNVEVEKYNSKAFLFNALIWYQETDLELCDCISCIKASCEQAVITTSEEVYSTYIARTPDHLHRYMRFCQNSVAEYCTTGEE